jgi:muramoyltetrapeptide carboxypeptidase
LENNFATHSIQHQELLDLKIPEPLKKGSRIAVTAFSAGISTRHEQRFGEIVRTLSERGYEVLIGECLRGEYKHVCAPKELRASELMQFLTDDSIDAVAPPWGGELAIEILPLLDFERLSRSKPKWLFGFSDVSTITTAINYRLGWITVHSSNLMDLVDTCSEPLIANTLSHLENRMGSPLIQFASDRHTRHWPDIEADPLASVFGDVVTEWKWLKKPSGTDVISGRLTGGCWDTLIHLFETPYLNFSAMKSTCPEGILLYLENAEMSPCDLVRAIHGMEIRGVFGAINGLILGRNARADSGTQSDLMYLDVIKEHLANKGIPVIYDVDIGHVPPNLTLFNGCYAEIGILNGQGKMMQWLK